MRNSKVTSKLNFISVIQKISPFFTLEKLLFPKKTISTKKITHPKKATLQANHCIIIYFSYSST